MDAHREMVELGGAGVSCLRWARPGASLLLFSHATGFNAETYRELLAPLAENISVIAADSRGHGFSTLPVAPGLAHNWTTFRDDLIALLEKLTSQPAILAGHSMGASVSLMVAALVPALVKGLVLIEPVLLDSEAPVAPNRLALRAAQRRSVFPSVDDALATYLGRGVFVTWPEDVIRDYLHGGMLELSQDSWRLACSPEWEAEIYREAPVGIGPLAAGTSCPLSILYGTNSSTASSRQLAAIRGARPDARLVQVEGASHFLPMEQPDRVREEILRMGEL